MIRTSVMKELNISKNLQFFEEYFIEEKYSSGKLKRSIKQFSISSSLVAIKFVFKSLTKRTFS